MAKLFYIGTYTEGTRSRGIYSAQLTEDGLLDGLAVETYKGVVNPSYLSVRGKKLYAVEEREIGELISYDIDEDGALEEKGRCPLESKGCCHVTTSPDGKDVFVSSYSDGGILVYSVNDEGIAYNMVEEAKYEGKGKNAERQDGPHTHSSFVDPSGKWLLVCDLGIDTVYVYEIASLGKEIKEKNVIYTPEGSGPRHLCFNKDGNRLYILTELSNEVLSYTFNAEDGTAELLTRHHTIPEDCNDETLAADIHLSENGKYLYASNRGYDSIAVFEITENGDTVPVDICKIDVNRPRSFAISGIYMIVAGQYSNNVAVYRLNQENGKPKDKVAEIAVPSPVCICMYDEVKG
ncbi:MAG: lactonase family protein [Lachnospiraceae bacterium]|nr:lactonase family protein [Lachnospiraceae bacterium]